MINDNNIYKIKDSVDLFLSNESYILAYFMNTRQKKCFKVNEETIRNQLNEIHTSSYAFRNTIIFRKEAII